MSTLQSVVLDANEIAQVSGGYYMDSETNWCGTRVPGWPRPKSIVLADALSLVALNPQPLPPRSADLGMALSY
jgi:hypothetical protein